MHVLILSFFVSFFLTLLLIRFDYMHLRFSGDSQLKGVQKFHIRTVPRIGGVAILAALGATIFLLRMRGRPLLADSITLLVLSGAPAFFGGLAEDLTKRVGIWLRLALTCLAAVLAYLMLGAALTRLDIPGVDTLLAGYWPAALLLTAFAVGGVANAINIIDGYNGLAAMVCAMILAAIGYVGYLVADELIWNTALVLVGALLGFMVWNWPRGMIFLGDGGAYLLGFIIAVLSVLLVSRHHEVSAWYPLLLVIYPVFETVFSMYRKKVLRGVSPGAPDGVHLHMLIHKRIVRFAVGSKHADLRLLRNSMTSPYLWVLCSLSVFPAVVFWRDTLWLQVLTLVFIFGYLWLYRAMVRFKVPHWMVMGGEERRRLDSLR